MMVRGKPTVRATRFLAVVALVFLIAAGAQARNGAEVQVLATHQGWVEANVGSRVSFGVNGTRVRWRDMENASYRVMCAGCR